MSLESKSILAKLMAQENLHIEQRPVSTASFNTKTRVLTVPILNNDIKPWTYDLFMGHEVGHALWTKQEDLVKAHKRKLSHSICNIVEDSRIERKIKDKYPGLRHSFSRAYKELFEADFFGTQEIDINELNFIDRVNLYCKVGVTCGVKFTPEEEQLLQLVESTSSFDDVMNVAEKIQKFMREQKKKEQTEQEEPIFSQDGPQITIKVEIDDFDLDEEEEEQADPISTTSSAATELNEGEEEKVDQGDAPSGEKPTLEETDEVKEDSKNLQDDKEESGNSLGGGETTDENQEEIVSKTDEVYKQKEKELFDLDAKERAYVNVPKINIDEAVMDYKDVYFTWKNETGQPGRSIRTSENYIKLRNSTSKAVSYLVKEFELRKNADELKRASTAKTGDLNMSKIYSYSYNEDIFKKITVMPGGKSHGLVMFLDWSGSMVGHIENTFKQLISLVFFCKKVNIPFEVYAFNQPEEDYYGGKERSYVHTSKPGEMKLGPFRLLNLLSSRMSAKDFTEAAVILSTYVCIPRGAIRPKFMSMGGTPLNEAIVSAMEIVPDFQKKNKLQTVNTVFLSDGEGHILREYITLDDYGQRTSEYLSRSSFYGAKDLVLCDPVTKCQTKVKNLDDMDANTNGYLELLKERTGSNVIGFYVLFSREFSKNIRRFFEIKSAYEFEEIKVQFRKEKYAIAKTTAYDDYYILKSEDLDTEEEEFVVKENATTRGLVSAFSKYTGGRVSSRIVLNKFIGLIT